MHAAKHLNEDAVITHIHHGAGHDVADLCSAHNHECCNGLGTVQTLHACAECFVVGMYADGVTSQCCSHHGRGCMGAWVLSTPKVSVALAVIAGILPSFAPTQVLSEALHRVCKNMQATPELAEARVSG